MAEDRSEQARNVATVKMMLAGYAHALHRLTEAVKARDPSAAFRAVFEALNWATAIDDRIGAHWAPEGKTLGWGWRAWVARAELMAGVRFVRNRVHHQWADAVWRDDSGIADPITDPIKVFTWRWRSLADLPTGRDDRGHDVYDEHMAGQRVERTLFELALAFEDVGRLLEPPRQQGPSQ